MNTDISLAAIVGVGSATMAGQWMYNRQKSSLTPFQRLVRALVVSSSGIGGYMFVAKYSSIHPYAKFGTFACLASILAWSLDDPVYYN